MLRDDLDAPRHPSDGGGRAWLRAPTATGATGATEGRAQVAAGSAQRFSIVFEVGPHGIAVGGAVFLQPSPFWYWDTPQVTYPEGPGFTVVRSDAVGVVLEPETLGPQLLMIRVAGRALAEGERLQIEFGAGPAGARVDRYAEQSSRIWLAVDGDGDGVRALLANSPSVDVVAGPPAQLVAILPTTARPGEPFQLNLALVDVFGNAGLPFEGEVALEVPTGLALPGRVVFQSQHLGSRRIEGVATREGVYRLRARIAGATAGGGELHAESNPLIVREEAPRILWGDLHGHSQLSDGTGTPEDYYRYARDVAALDVAALTDHDHWGLQPLDAHPALWKRIRDATQRFHAPGHFVTLLGYEWTNWLHGHRHVLYFGEQGEVWSSLDPRYETPAQLWEALVDRPALTFAHHSAGGPISTNWDYRPDPRVEPVTEITSVHGNSEALDGPTPIYSPVVGNFVRDVLGQGLRFGFIGSGDSHDGHPGLAHLGAASGGLAAILSEQHTRTGVLEALRARRVYATNGPRIWLRFSVDDHTMGTTLGANPSAEHTFQAAAATQAPIERIELIRSGTVIDLLGSESAPKRREWSTSGSLPRLAAGEYIYLRVVQEDGGAAWSSPIFAD